MPALEPLSAPPKTAAPGAPVSRGSILGRLAVRAVSPVDIGPLVWFRVAFGAIMLLEVYRYMADGYVERYYIKPDFYFKYYGFSWVHPWPGNGMHLHFAILGIAAFCILCGWGYRIATTVFFLGFTYVFLLDQSRYLNHFYFVCLLGFLMIFVPAHRALSVDAWLRPRLRKPTAPAWSLDLLRLQVCIVYFFGGIAKINEDWLRGEPLRHWLAERTDFPVIGHYFTQEWMVYFFSYTGLIFDLLIAPMLYWRRTRWLAFGLAAVFNLTNARLFNIGIFPWLTLGASVLLFLPRVPRPFPRLWGGPRPAHSLPGPASLKPQHKLTLSLVALYLAVQCLVPLRHWLYPGDVAWNELGHRFSWRMKLRSKDVDDWKFTARDPVTGATWEVDQDDFLTNRQWDEASTRPDMILQLCHHMAEHSGREGVKRAEIRAWLMVSLNYREPQLLVDPAVDLAAQPRTLGTPGWITTLTTPRRGAKPLEKRTES